MIESSREFRPKLLLNQKSEHASPAPSLTLSTLSRLLIIHWLLVMLVFTEQTPPPGNAHFASSKLSLRGHGVTNGATSDGPTLHQFNRKQQLEREEQEKKPNNKVTEEPSEKSVQIHSFRTQRKNNNGTGHN
ncbi:hypothetical protein EYF80_024039 [Liparis tanakae]|uniref:Uncharacterized protein n=1 Tax=Liparis tanakae TaxID=230148 RepID=A0A4Z2HIW2_9TELE|nr:hypothetical protein EYF80_024039 [Liparis tanakae]